MMDCPISHASAVNGPIGGNITDFHGDGGRVSQVTDCDSSWQGVIDPETDASSRKRALSAKLF